MSILVRLLIIQLVTVSVRVPVHVGTDVLARHPVTVHVHVLSVLRVSRDLVVFGGGGGSVVWGVVEQPVVFGVGVGA